MNLDKSGGNGVVRRVHCNELPQLLDLYRQLNPNDAPLPPIDAVNAIWEEIQANPRLHYFVIAIDNRLVSTCALTIVPNLTRGARPYGLIENVITDVANRRQGYAGALLRAALNYAWSVNCYKVMLMTGSKRESTLRFYESVGFRRDIKVGLVAIQDEG